MTAAPIDPARLPTIELSPIGVVRCELTERSDAPRQPAAGRGLRGRIELRRGGQFEHAVHDLERWSHIWVIFSFHLNLSSGWRGKVSPPRSGEKRGVLATRSPHRPNPIGLSLVRLERVEGHMLHVVDLDILDGSPVLDIKPYVAYADTAEQARDGWLPDGATADPMAGCEVAWSERAQQQLQFLEARGCGWLRQRAQDVLSLGGAPHPYRRIKPDGDGMRLAVKDFRLRFHQEGAHIVVERISSGYKRKQLLHPDAQQRADTPLSVHREFVAAFDAGPDT